MLLGGRIGRGKKRPERHLLMLQASPRHVCVFASLLLGEQPLPHLPPSDHAIFISFLSPSAYGDVGLEQQQRDHTLLQHRGLPSTRLVAYGRETKTEGIGRSPNLEGILHAKDTVSSSALGLLEHLSSLALCPFHHMGCFPELLRLGADHRCAVLHRTALPAPLELLRVFLQLPETAGSSGMKGHSSQLICSTSPRRKAGIDFPWGCQHVCFILKLKHNKGRGLSFAMGQTCQS